MSFELDEEILQDFLVESGEILELLSEQLVELEQAPDNADLLNSIFRGFHTVKGGAGFLQLDALVECCHIAENVFDILRKGERSVTPELMDCVLQALDSVNEMFTEVQNGDDPTAADPALLKQLDVFAKPESEDEVVAEEEPVDEEEPGDESDDVVALEADTADSGLISEGRAGDDITDTEYEQILDAISPAGNSEVNQSSDIKNDTLSTEPVSDTDSDDITDDEFETLLDQLHGKGKFSAVAETESAVEASKASDPSASENDSDEITDDEFETLLDQLHGKGKFSAAPETESAAEPSNKPESADSENDSDEITDQEFEALLDQLHGKGQFKGATDDSGSAASTPKTEPKIPKQGPVAKDTKPKVKKPVVKKAKPVESETVSAPVEPPKLATKKVATEKTPAAQETTVRVDTKRLDDIMNMVGELVLVRNRLVRLGAQYSDEGLQKAVGNLDVVTADLQASVMKTRMQPIKKVFGRFPRVVRDLARSLKKEINLELIGEETDLDKNLVEALSDPLVHLVRNSVDHGVEMPDVREQNGKSRTGKIVLSAQQEGDHILLMIEDDGAGMDAEKLRGLAVKRGMMDQESADRLSDGECYALIFAPGFSTKEKISDVSGRGVGMDVVKTKITQLNGSVDIESEMGVGTKVLIKVPLTLAIMPTLMVMLHDQAFALPLVNVSEIFHLDISKTNVVDGKEVVLVRGKAIPLYHLGKWMTDKLSDLVTDTEGDKEKTAHVVVVSIGNLRVGFVVDQLVGQEEVVIKPLGKMLHGTPGMSGATITGDGRIALILDVPSLLKYYA